MISKFELAILRYERARQLVGTLNHKRKTLIANCEGIDTCEDNHNQIVSFGVVCFSRAWEKMLEINKESGPYDGVTFEDVLVDGVGIEDEPACDNCLEAYRIKHHELRDAKKEFGAAKRSIAALGKSLIDQDSNNESK